MPTNYKCSLLAVDNDLQVLAALSVPLQQEFEVLIANSVEAAQEIFAQRSIDLILADQKMPGASGVQLLEWVRERSPKTIRLLMTGFADLEDAVEAINRGEVQGYVVKPWRAEELMIILRDAARTFNLKRANDRLVEEVSQLNRDLYLFNHAPTAE